MARTLWPDLDGAGFFPAQIEGKLAFTMVMLDVAKSAPIESCPNYHIVSFDYEPTDPHGFPSDESAQQLYDIEDALFPLLENELTGVYVGRATRDGRRHFYMYAEAATIPQELLEEALKLTGAEELEVSSFKDPEWEQYFDCLYPNEMAYHYILGMRALDNGKVDPTRAVHVLYFPDAARRNAAAAAAAEDDFPAVAEDLTAEVGVNDEYRMRVVQDAPDDHDLVYHVTETLIVIASETGGRYSHCEIEGEGADLRNIPTRAKLTIAAEVVAGIRPESDLERFGLEVGEPRTIESE